MGDSPKAQPTHVIPGAASPLHQMAAERADELFNDRRLGRKASPGYGELSKDQFNDYTKSYRAGYRHSTKAANPDLDRNPYQDDPRSRAWEDGYLDAAVGREKYALRGHRFGTGDPVEGY